MTEVPKITKLQAAVLLLAGQAAIPISIARSLADRGMLSLGDDNGTFDLVATTTLGRAALANFEAEREREIRNKVLEECLQSADRWERNDRSLRKRGMQGVDVASWIKKEVER